MSLAKHTAALRKAYQEHARARDQVYCAGADNDHTPFNECLKGCPSSIRERFEAAQSARFEAEAAAIAAGYCYRSNGLLWWTQSRHRSGVVSFEEGRP